MKWNYSKIAKIVLGISIAIIIVGYFLWTIILPVPDFHILSDTEQLITQKELAFNYPLGRVLLYVGFTGLITSSVYLIINTIKNRQESNQ